MIGRALGWQLGVGFGTVLTIVGGAPPVHAQAPAGQHAYDLPAQDLGRSLRAVAVASGRNVIAAAKLIQGRVAPALHGRFSAEEAVTRLLVGSGLHVRTVGGDIVVEADAGSARTSQNDGQPSGIVVTGSRIRGAPVASPVIAVGQADIRNQALAGLGEVVRRIPQSFGGGQNPGIGATVPAASGGDVGGGSSLNLRGLGSDATLTLLNGHRLAYTAALQSVDVSAIPSNAVDRIEVVPDGASAIYGSDAVAGVANIVLRRDYSGLETGARLAAATDGGDFQQRYDALAGTTWSSGGVWAAYEYGSNSAIRASDRSYASRRSPGLDLFPALRHDSIVASGHQDLGDASSVGMDGLYNIRWSDLTMPTLPGGDLEAGRATFHSVDKSFGLAPTLELRLPADWRVSLAATYGRERVDFHQVQCAGDLCNDSGPNFYRNSARSLEIAGSGGLVALPGGMSKVAVGAGYRDIGFRRFSKALSAVDTEASQDSYFVYGEVSLPLVGPDEGLPLVHRFDVDAALRYERYPGIGGVVTPKLGMAWGLTPDITLKGTWGQSFRAPTLYQQYQPRAATLYPPALLGAAASPTAGAILLLGGNPALKPERATAWSTSLDLHPRAIPGLTLAVGYFDVAYRDRIVSPVTLLSQALSNPAYGDRVSLDPSPAEQAAALASAATFTNFTGVSYDPANVIALIDDAYVNAGRQWARGVDFLASYAGSIAPGQRLAISADVAYLDSAQRLTPSQPRVSLAGTIYNPPHWRGQGIATWSSGPLSLTGAVNYVGGLRDIRLSPPGRIEAMTTVDLTARYRVEGTRGPLEDLQFALSVQDLFNAKPDPIVVRAPYETPYDSTNYSPVGRLIAIEVRKSW
jgi:outer membrane receptor protein involved in Fe transport